MSSDKSGKSIWVRLIPAHNVKITRHGADKYEKQIRSWPKANIIKPVNIDEYKDVVIKSIFEARFTNIYMMAIFDHTRSDAEKAFNATLSNNTDEIVLAHSIVRDGNDGSYITQTDIRAKGELLKYGLANYWQPILVVSNKLYDTPTVTSEASPINAHVIGGNIGMTTNILGASTLDLHDKEIERSGVTDGWIEIWPRDGSIVIGSARVRYYSEEIINALFYTNMPATHAMKISYAQRRQSLLTALLEELIYSEAQFVTNSADAYASSWYAAYISVITSIKIDGDSKCAIHMQGLKGMGKGKIYIYAEMLVDRKVRKIALPVIMVRHGHSSPSVLYNFLRIAAGVVKMAIRRESNKAMHDENLEMLERLRIITARLHIATKTGNHAI